MPCGPRARRGATLVVRLRSSPWRGTGACSLRPSTSWRSSVVFSVASAIELLFVLRAAEGGELYYTPRQSQPHGWRPFPESLCHRCAAPPKYVRTGRSTFMRCPLLAEKYPRQPVAAVRRSFRPADRHHRAPRCLRELTPADEPFVASMTDSVADAADWVAPLLRALRARRLQAVAGDRPHERRAGRADRPARPDRRRRRRARGLVPPARAPSGARATPRRRRRRARLGLRRRLRSRHRAHPRGQRRSQAVARALGDGAGGRHAMHARRRDHVVWRVDRR